MNRDRDHDEIAPGLERWWAEDLEVHPTPRAATGSGRCSSGSTGPLRLGDAFLAQPLLGIHERCVQLEHSPGPLVDDSVDPTDNACSSTAIQ
jgi:hypothetical protein